MLEAVNENQSGCFGWAMEEVYDKERGYCVKVKLGPETCLHHHQNTQNLVGGAAFSNTSDDPPADSARSWIWWPSSYDFRTHYRHDIGFLASLILMLGATVFWVSGCTALPGIFDRMTRGEMVAFYWTPQVLGGIGFVVSGWLFMVETQTSWWQPAFGVLGWHVGFWNWIGGIGFLLCPSFGYSTSRWAQFQAVVATFWGSDS